VGDDDKASEGGETSSLGDFASEIEAATNAAADRMVEGKPRDDGELPEGAAPDDDAEHGDGIGDETPAEPEAGAADDSSRDDKGRFAKPKPAGDDAIERAVRLGIPMAEAKQYTESLLSLACDRIEGKTGEGKPAGGKEEDGEAKPAGDPLDAIPDLDPAIYDENIVAGFKALKGVAKALREENATLRGDKSKDFMATQLEGVRELTKGDQSKETAVREKFDVLRAGYKAAGKDVADVTVFKEASQLVLGMDADSMKNKKADAARRRAGQRISPPSGQRVEVKPDVAAETAELLDRKYFAKS